MHLVLLHGFIFYYIIYHMMNKLVRLFLLKHTGIPVGMIGIVAFAIVAVIMWLFHRASRNRRRYY